MADKVFFSWQSDVRQTAFVRACLDTAIAELNSESSVDEPLRELTADQDTHINQSIADTILKDTNFKYAFLADLSFVAGRMKSS